MTFIKNMSRTTRIVLGFALPIGGWSLQLILSYALSASLCQGQTPLVFHGISLVGVMMAFLGFAIARESLKNNSGDIVFNLAAGFGLLLTVIIFISDFANFFLRICQ